MSVKNSVPLQRFHDMPAISVLLDDLPVATVNTAGLTVISVNVHGDRMDPVFASIDVHGTTSDTSTYLIWASGVPLQPGQRVELRFLESGETSAPGKTIDELFPDDSCDEPEEVPVASMFDELRARPRLRRGFMLHLDDAAGAATQRQTAEDDHAFSLNLVWNMYRPERVYYSLSSRTLDELERGEALRYDVRKYAHAPHTLRLTIDSLSELGASAVAGGG